MEEKTKINNPSTKRKKTKDLFNPEKEISNKIISIKPNSQQENFYDIETIYKNKELNKFKDEMLAFMRSRDFYYMEKLNNLKSQLEKNDRNFENLNEYSMKTFNTLLSAQTEMQTKLEKLNKYDTFIIFFFIFYYEWIILF